MFVCWAPYVAFVDAVALCGGDAVEKITVLNVSRSREFRPSFAHMAFNCFGFVFVNAHKKPHTHKHARHIYIHTPGNGQSVCAENVQHMLYIAVASVLNNFLVFVSECLSHHNLHTNAIVCGGIFSQEVSGFKSRSLESSANGENTTVETVVVHLSICDNYYGITCN